MEFKQLQSYVAVIKYGSFTKAAEKMFVSQPTISAHISALEEELNQTLIRRTTKSIEITEKGKEVYEQAVHILEMKDRMIDICTEEEHPNIYLGASTIPSAYILPEILPKFRNTYPELSFSIEQSDSQGVVDGLLEGRFDVGFIGIKEEKLVCEPFCEDRMVLVTASTPYFQELKAASQEEILVQRLLSEPMILREQGSGSGKYASNIVEELGLSEKQLRVTARINDQETIKHLVAGGLGVSIISEMAARDFVENGKLLQFELPVHNTRSLYLVYRKEEVLKPHVKLFADFVCQNRKLQTNLAQ